MRQIAIVAFSSVSLLLAACATTTPDATAPVDTPGGKPAAPVQTQPVKPVDVTGKPGATPLSALKDPKNILSQRSIFYDLDQYDIKDEFNANDPVDDVKNHLKPLSETLQRHGYAPDEAEAAALTVLPDILHYDRTMPAHYPNGRVMTDDVFSIRMIFMTHGAANPQGVKPHDDLMQVFPFLGLPHR